MPSINFQVAQCGGAVVLELIQSSGLPNNTNILLQRYTGSLSSTPVVLYNGPWSGSPVFIDDGEQNPSFLDSGTTYYYSLSDEGGTAVTPGIIPASQVSVQQNFFDRLIFRLFESGINSISIPDNFKRVNVLQQMPLTGGSDLLPFVVMNLDLEQQENVQIGESAGNTGTTNTYSIPAYIFRRYSINVFCFTSVERDFYKEAIKAVFYSILTTLSEIGQDITISYQVSQTQASSQQDLNMPGFFSAHFMIDTEGTFVSTIQTNYPLIESVVPIVNGEGVSDTD